MAKTKAPNKGLQLLAFIGGLALMMVAWKFPVPLIIAQPTTLLSVCAVVYGILMGWRYGIMVTAVYVIALIVNIPAALWHEGVSSTPFSSVPFNGLNLGLIAAALVASLLTPAGGLRDGYGRIAAAVVLGHLVYLLCGIGWASRFAPPLDAAEAILKSQIIPVVLKSGISFGLVVLGGRYITGRR